MADSNERLRISFGRTALGKEPSWDTRFYFHPEFDSSVVLVPYPPYLLSFYSCSYF